MAIYSWHEIGDVPAASGVYAWYYTPEITAFDLDRITSDILQLKADRGASAAKNAVRDFLDETVFRYFREQPYSAQLRGALKPRYEGKIEHRRSLAARAADR